MAEDKGGLQERWQYRQEMKAHGAWGHRGSGIRTTQSSQMRATWRPGEDVATAQYRGLWLG